MTVFVGGISELFQSDLDLGRLAIDRLAGEELGPDVVVEELHYGAVAVSQRLQEVRPDALVLISAVRRGRLPGSVERRRIVAPTLSESELQAAVGDAVTGYVHLDLVVAVAAGFGQLPARSVAVEVEPESTEPGEGLTPAAQRGLEIALHRVRTELRRLPLLALADELRALLESDRLGASASLDTLRLLLDELLVVDRDGRWGHTFALRDRLTLDLAHQVSSEEMEPRDWALWWALIEELGRLQAQEGEAG